MPSSCFHAGNMSLMVNNNKRTTCLKKVLETKETTGSLKSKPPQFSGTSLPLHSFHALVWQQRLTKPRLLFRRTGFIITTLLTNSMWVLRKNRWYNDNNKSRWQGSTKDTEVALPHFFSQTMNWLKVNAKETFFFLNCDNTSLPLLCQI